MTGNYFTRFVEFITHNISLLKIAVKQFLTGHPLPAVDFPELTGKKYAMSDSLSLITFLHSYCSRFMNISQSAFLKGEVYA